MKKSKFLPGLFTVLMLLMCVFMCAYTVGASVLRDRITDVELSLETSRGRERKQQYEYDEAAEQLPLVRAELAEVRPLADAAERKVADLKAERKELRALKESLLSADGSQEETATGEDRHE